MKAEELLKEAATRIKTLMDADTVKDMLREADSMARWWHEMGPKIMSYSSQFEVYPVDADLYALEIVTNGINGAVREAMEGCAQGVAEIMGVRRVIQ